MSGWPASLRQTDSDKPRSGDLADEGLIYLFLDLFIFLVWSLLFMLSLPESNAVQLYIAIGRFCRFGLLSVDLVWP